MTLEEIRRIFSNPPAEYPKSLNNPGDLCPWCGTITEYRRLNPDTQPFGWKCPNCKREGYFSVKYQFDPLEAPRETPNAEDDPCPQCGNPVRNIWDPPDKSNLKSDQWWCRHCRAQGRYQDIPF